MNDQRATHAGNLEKSEVIPRGRETKSCRHRILVVDDDDDIRRFNEEALTAFGYHVEAAEDGAAGWDALNANSYDLLITDSSMPKLTGIELIKKLNAACMPVRVILASGVIPADEMELRLAATLPKPYTLDQLLETVRTVLTPTGSEWQSPSARNEPPAEGLRL